VIVEYAVIDVETTGIYPGGHDRIVEVAIVRIDRDFEVIDEYSSLLNPGRDLGPTWLHGISAGDVLDAPSFGDVAGDIVERLQGAVVVGHNVPFDLRFIEAEFRRLGHEIQRPPYIDTLPVVHSMEVPSRRLSAACEFLSIELGDTHSALGDARATAALFERCCEHLGASHVLAPTTAQREPESVGWPSLRSRRAAYPRACARAAKAQRGGYLAALVRDLPTSSCDPPDWQPYLAVLDRALEDRRITEEEIMALQEVAQDCEMSREHLRAANLSYLKSLVALARQDGFVSETERRDIEEVAQLLDLGAEVPRLLDQPYDADTQPPASTGIELRGRTICFTGALAGIVNGERATREFASAVAREHGMEVMRGVTKGLDYLVVADPDSMSSKATKARRFGTRILAEAVFWNLTGVDTGG
jgi:DNA polymerase III subunit epsilon